MSGDRVMMVVGPGPVTLGQGPEFQFTAARGCRYLRGMGMRVIVLEDNPSTLMDVGGGEEGLFMEPPAPEVVEKVVKRTGAQSIWFSLGGKRGWNLALRLAGEGWYERLGLEPEGAEDRALWLCGDRSLLRETLERRGISNPAFRAVADFREGQEAAVSLGFPLLVRPHFSCGGWGAGLAYNLEEYPLLLDEAMRESITGEVLVEEALIGWRKYVVLALRDGEGRSRVAGVVEQAEPLPRHDQDAVLAYPSISLGEEEAYGLGELAKEVAEALDIVGLAEIKLAVDPGWKEVYVIDVNPCPWRVFPLLETALGEDLLRIHISLVMGGELNREGSDTGNRPGFGIMLAVPRLGYEEENMGEGYSALGSRALARRVYTGKDLGEAVEEVMRGLISTGEGSPEREALKGVRYLSARLGKSGRRQVRTKRGEENTRKIESLQPLCISRTSQGDLADAVVFLAGDDGGPSGGYEAEVNCLNALEAWRKAGGRALFCTADPSLAMYGSGEADAVYLAPLEAGALGGIVSSTGACRFAVGYGGRAALECGKDLARAGYEVVDGVVLQPGAGIMQALDSLSSSGIPVADFRLSGDMEEASEVLEEGIYPLLATVDSGGTGLVQRLIYTEEDGRAFLEEFKHEVVLWREVREGRQEVQVEAIASAARNHVALAWEQVDEAGICACDGLAVFPPSYLTSGQSQEVSALAEKAMDVLGWRGNLSMRMVFEDGEVNMWEITPGPSSSLPFLLRASGKPMAAWGFMALSGRSPEEMMETPRFNVVRAPLIPFAAIASDDILPSPQRRSTGAVLGVASEPGVALAKALWSEGLRPQPGGRAFLSVANREKRRALLLARELQAAGYILMATKGTAHALSAAGLKIATVNKLREGRPNILDHIRNGEVGLVINIPRGKSPHSDGFYIRAASARHGIPCITNMEVALALARGLRNADPADWEVRPLEEYGRSRQEVRDG